MEAKVRPVQVRIVPSGDAVEFAVRVPRQALESTALDPEGVAKEIAAAWARQYRDYFNLPPASGSPLVIPGAGTNLASVHSSGERN